MIIDATDLKVGRLCTVAAKAALKGETVEIVNSETAVFTGSPDYVVAKYRQRRNRGGPHWGPFYPRMPDRFLRRIIRAMFPTDTARGKEAFKRVMCYIGNPENKEAQTIKEAHISNSKTMKFVSVKQVCHALGGNHE